MTLSRTRLFLGVIVVAFASFLALSATALAVPGDSPANAVLLNTYLGSSLTTTTVPFGFQGNTGMYYLRAELQPGQTLVADFTSHPGLVNLIALVLPDATVVSTATSPTVQRLTYTSTASTVQMASIYVGTSTNGTFTVAPTITTGIAVSRTQFPPIAYDLKSLLKSSFSLTANTSNLTARLRVFTPGQNAAGYIDAYPTAPIANTAGVEYRFPGWNGMNGTKRLMPGSYSWQLNLSQGSLHKTVTGTGIISNIWIPLNGNGPGNPTVYPRYQNKGAVKVYVKGWTTVASPNQGMWVQVVAAPPTVWSKTNSSTSPLTTFNSTHPWYPSTWNMNLPAQSRGPVSTFYSWRIGASSGSSYQISIVQ